MREASVEVVLEPFTTPALDRVRIAQFTAAMRDANPVHADEDFCRALGLPGIIAPGGMAVVALAQRRPPLRPGRGAGDVALTAPTFAGQRLVCRTCSPRTSFRQASLKASRSWRLGRYHL